MLNGQLSPTTITGGRHIQQGMLVPEAYVIPPPVSQQACTIQPIGKNQEPCTCVTVLFVLSCHRRFALAAVVKKDPIILELTLLSHLSSLSGTDTVCPRVKPSLGVHNGHHQVASCCKQGHVYTWSSIHGLHIASPPSMTVQVRSWRYSPSTLVEDPGRPVESLCGLPPQGARRTGQCW
jgi:hypothetical protein